MSLLYSGYHRTRIDCEAISFKTHPFPLSIQQKRNTLSSKCYDKASGLDVDRDMDRARCQASRIRRNSWPSCNSLRRQSATSCAYARVSNGSIWLTQKPVSTLDTSPGILGMKYTTAEFSIFEYCTSSEYIHELPIFQSLHFDASDRIKDTYTSSADKSK